MVRPLFTCRLLITYRQLYWVNESLNIWLVIQLAIIFIVTAFYSPHQVYLGFFSANFIGWFSSKQSFYKAYTLFVLILCSALIVGILYGDIPLTLYQLINIPFLLIMFVAPFGIRSMNKKMELEKKLDEANEQIKNLVKKEERLRIARDLHDTLGHTLSFITLQSQLAQKFVDKDPERAKQAAKEIEITSRSALKQVRELVTNMRTTTIVEELSEMEKF